MLAREVDEAVRKDQMSDVATRYGKPILAVVVLGLAAFAGYLYWDAQHEGELEAQSETIVSALDQMEANNLDTAQSTLQPIADGGMEGGKAIAMMLQAGIAQEKGDNAQASALFASVADDAETPESLRDLAIIRSVAAGYDDSTPADVITKLQALAVPDNPYFGSAGEMVAMAYLEQGKRKQAGEMFAKMANADNVPAGLQSRARRMAGVLGVDAIEDVDAVLEEAEAQAAAAGQAGGNARPAAPQSAPQTQQQPAPQQPAQ